MDKELQAEFVERMKEETLCCDKEMAHVRADFVSHDSVTNKEVIAAGFVQFYPNPIKDDDSEFAVDCFGESVTLKVKSRKEVDAKLIIDIMFKKYY